MDFQPVSERQLMPEDRLALAMLRESPEYVEDARVGAP